LKEDRSLFSRLKTWIDSVQLVDVHCHINGERPAAGDPKEIVFYHYIITELTSAGVPLEAFSSDFSFEQVMRRTLPYFKLIRNTSTHWCLMKMLRDLYGFEGDEINEKNWKDLRDAIISQAKERDWYKAVLTEKTKLRKGFLTFRYDEEIPKYDPDFYVGTLRIEPLINRLNQADIKGLEGAVNASVESIDDFEDALSLLFKKFSTCVAVTASVLPEETFVEASKAEAEETFKKRLSGLDLNASEMRNVSSFAMSCVLSLAEEYGLPFQFMVGVRRPVVGASPPDYAIAGFETKSLVSLCPLFHRFRNVNFDIFLANKVQCHELAVIAKNYPNVHVSGYWWYTFYPAIIREFLLERLEMLPRNKIGGFFSDAYVVEWTYAKASMVRLQLAKVLAEMVEEGYCTEDLAKDLAVDLLIRNAEHLYKLK